MNCTICNSELEVIVYVEDFINPETVSSHGQREESVYYCDECEKEVEVE